MSLSSAIEVSRPAHVLGRVVGLQVGRPVGDQAVAGGVRLVEGVVGERDEDVPERLDRGLGVAVGPHPLGEGDVLLVQDLLLLLAHRAAQQVGAAQGVAGQLLGDRHDLLLVDDQPVGVAQDLGQRLGELGVDRRDRLAAVLAVGEVVVRVGAHRARPVERQDRGDVLEVGRGQAREQCPHAGVVQLEHAQGVAAGEQLVGGDVVEGQLLEDDLVAPVGLDVAQRVVEDRQVAQAQEVHLEQAEGLAGPHVELGDDRAVLLAAHDRDDVEQRLGRQDHAGRVHAPLPAQALEAACGVDDLAQVRLALVERAELRGLLVAGVARVEDPGQRDVLAHDRRRHRLGEPLPHGERVAEHAGGVLEGGLGLDRAVGDDLGDPLLAVALGGVADHLGAPALVEVHVDVGHRDALGVEEPLEQQAVAHRVELGDPQGVGDQRTGGRPTARADADADALGVVDEVGGHQEVAGEAHLADDAHLVGGLVAAVLRHAVREPVGQAALDLLDQPRLLGLPLGHREAGHEVAALGELHVAALGDQQGVVARLGMLGPERAHLLGGLQVEVAGVELEPVRVGHRLAGLHAQQHLVGLGVRGVRVVQVVGGQQRAARGPWPGAAGRRGCGARSRCRGP